MLSSFRDPLRSTVFDDWTGIDPWSFGSDILPLSGGLGTNTVGGRGRVKTGGRLMTLDAFEDQNEFKVIVEVPGVEKDKLDVNVENNILTIRCNKPSPDFSNASGFVRNEIFYGTDTRTIRLPSSVSEEPSCCCYKDGVLCISFPKSPEKEAKKLQIET